MPSSGRSAEKGSQGLRADPFDAVQQIPSHVAVPVSLTVKVGFNGLANRRSKVFKTATILLRALPARFAQAIAFAGAHRDQFTTATHQRSQVHQGRVRRRLQQLRPLRRAVQHCRPLRQHPRIQPIGLAPTDRYCAQTRGPVRGLNYCHRKPGDAECDHTVTLITSGGFDHNSLTGPRDQVFAQLLDSNRVILETLDRTEVTSATSRVALETSIPTKTGSEVFIVPSLQ